MPVKPDEATLAEIEKAGLKVLDYAGANSGKELFSRERFDFRDLAALRLTERLEIKGERENSSSHTGSNLWLSKDKKGLYTLEVEFGPYAESDAEDEAQVEPEAGDGTDGEAAPPEDPEAAKKRVQEAKSLMGELVAEAAKFKLVIGLKIPGEIVEYSPNAGAKSEGGSVTWTLDFRTTMQSLVDARSKPQETEDADGPDLRFRVVFKMPEGKSIPDSALRARKAAEPKAAPGETAPAGPVVPPAPVPRPPEPTPPKNDGE